MTPVSLATNTLPSLAQQEGPSVLEASPIPMSASASPAVQPSLGRNSPEPGQLLPSEQKDLPPREQPATAPSNFHLPFRTLERSAAPPSAPLRLSAMFYGTAQLQSSFSSSSESASDSSSSVSPAAQLDESQAAETGYEEPGAYPFNSTAPIGNDYLGQSAYAGAHYHTSPDPAYELANGADPYPPGYAHSPAGFAFMGPDMQTNRLRPSPRVAPPKAARPRPMRNMNRYGRPLSDIMESDVLDFDTPETTTPLFRSQFESGSLQTPPESSLEEAKPEQQSPTSANGAGTARSSASVTPTPPVSASSDAVFLSPKAAQSTAELPRHSSDTVGSAKSKEALSSPKEGAAPSLRHSRSLSIFGSSVKSAVFRSRSRSSSQSEVASILSAQESELKKKKKERESPRKLTKRKPQAVPLEKEQLQQQQQQQQEKDQPDTSTTGSDGDSRSLRNRSSTDRPSVSNSPYASSPVLPPPGSPVTRSRLSSLLPSASLFRRGSRKSNTDAGEVEPPESPAAPTHAPPPPPPPPPPAKAKLQGNPITPTESLENADPNNSPPLAVSPLYWKPRPAPALPLITVPTSAENTQPADESPANLPAEPASTPIETAEPNQPLVEVDSSGPLTPAIQVNAHTLPTPPDTNTTKKPVPKSPLNPSYPDRTASASGLRSTADPHKDSDSLSISSSSSSESLTKKAEQLLATAKKRLSQMEGNLRGARTSLLVGSQSRPSSVMSMASCRPASAMTSHEVSPNPGGSPAMGSRPIPLLLTSPSIMASTRQTPPFRSYSPMTNPSPTSRLSATDGTQPSRRAWTRIVLAPSNRNHDGSSEASVAHPHLRTLSETPTFGASDLQSFQGPTSRPATVTGVRLESSSPRTLPLSTMFGHIPLSSGSQKLATQLFRSTSLGRPASAPLRLPVKPVNVMEGNPLGISRSRLSYLGPTGVPNDAPSPAVHQIPVATPQAEIKPTWKRRTSSPKPVPAEENAAVSDQSLKNSVTDSTPPRSSISTSQTIPSPWAHETKEARAISDERSDVKFRPAERPPSSASKESGGSATERFSPDKESAPADPAVGTTSNAEQPTRLGLNSLREEKWVSVAARQGVSLKVGGDSPRASSPAESLKVRSAMLDERGTPELSQFLNVEDENAHRPRTAAGHGFSEFDNIDLGRDVDYEALKEKYSKIHAGESTQLTLAGLESFNSANSDSLLSQVNELQARIEIMRRGVEMISRTELGIDFPNQEGYSEGLAGVNEEDDEEGDDGDEEEADRVEREASRSHVENWLAHSAGVGNDLEPVLPERISFDYEDKELELGSNGGISPRNSGLYHEGEGDQDDDLDDTLPTLSLVDAAGMVEDGPGSDQIVRHEDRPDAFDYETFYLHSLLGSIHPSSDGPDESSGEEGLGQEEDEGQGLGLDFEQSTLNVLDEAYEVDVDDAASDATEKPSYEGERVPAMPYQYRSFTSYDRSPGKSRASSRLTRTTSRASVNTVETFMTALAPTVDENGSVASSRMGHYSHMRGMSVESNALSTNSGNTLRARSISPTKPLLVRVDGPGRSHSSFSGRHYGSTTAASFETGGAGAHLLLRPASTSRAMFERERRGSPTRPPLLPRSAGHTPVLTPTLHSLDGPTRRSEFADAYTHRSGWPMSSSSASFSPSFSPTSQLSPHLQAGKLPVLAEQDDDDGAGGGAGATVSAAAAAASRSESAGSGAFGFPGPMLSASSAALLRHVSVRSLSAEAKAELVGSVLAANPGRGGSKVSAAPAAMPSSDVNSVAALALGLKVAARQLQLAADAGANGAGGGAGSETERVRAALRKATERVWDALATVPAIERRVGDAIGLE